MNDALGPRPSRRRACGSDTLTPPSQREKALDHAHNASPRRLGASASRCLTRHLERTDHAADRARLPRGHPAERRLRGVGGRCARRGHRRLVRGRRLLLRRVASRRHGGADRPCGHGGGGQLHVLAGMAVEPRGHHGDSRAVPARGDHRRRRTRLCAAGVLPARLPGTRCLRHRRGRRDPARIRRACARSLGVACHHGHRVPRRRPLRRDGGPPAHPRR